MPKETLLNLRFSKPNGCSASAYMRGRLNAMINRGTEVTAADVLRIQNTAIKKGLRSGRTHRALLKSLKQP